MFLKMCCTEFYFGFYPFQGTDTGITDRRENLVIHEFYLKLLFVGFILGQECPRPLPETYNSLQNILNMFGNLNWCWILNVFYLYHAPAN